MVKTSSTVKKQPNIKVTHNVERVNLYDFAYEKAGAVKGDPDVFASYLDMIVNGDLVEEPYKGFTEEEKKITLETIKRAKAIFEQRK